MKLIKYSFKLFILLLLSPFILYSKATRIQEETLINQQKAFDYEVVADLCTSITENSSIIDVTYEFGNNPLSGKQIYYIKSTARSCTTTTATLTLSGICTSSYTSPSGKYVYTVSGTYTDTIPNVAGCDSIITINLNLTKINDTVTVNGNVLTALENNAKYQWLDCANSYAAMPGDTLRTKLVTGCVGTTYNYAVRISKNGCIDTSICKSITVGFNQLGIDLDGEVVNDQSGRSVSTSADGYTVAIGAINNDGNGLDAGHVRIYDWTAGAWVKRGNDIDGEAAGDRSGYSVSLSDNGNTVAIGAWGNDGNGTSSGHVRIYDWNAGVWVQRGADIDGEAAYDYSGWSVSLSSNGNTVAIGAHGNDGNGLDAGHVRIYDWTAGAWIKKGNDIEGESAGDASGYSVSLSANGNTVAIGAYGNDGNGSGAGAGHVRIYDWTAGAWLQRGNDINGETMFDNSGYSVSLSANGNTVAIGAPFNIVNGLDVGHVRIYDWDAGVWVKRGDDIDGEAAVDNSGYSVSLSDNGNTVAIGANNNDGNGFNSGHVRIYDYMAGAWVKRGNDLDGEAGYDQSGWSVSLSDNAELIAVGAPYNNGNGKYAGHVKVYQIKCNTSGGCSPTSSNITASSSCSGIYTSPSGKYTWTVSGTYTDTIPNVAGCDSIITINLNILKINDTVTVNGNVLTALENNAKYQWLDCANNYAAMPGDTFQTKVFTGCVGMYNYAVSISKNGCVDTSICSSVNINSNQLGIDLDGEAAGDRSGWSVSTSADGKTVAIGAPYNDGNGPDVGHVRIYDYIAGVWVQRGTNINGAAAGDHSGFSVSLSGGGNTVAIGAPYNDGNGPDAGHVRIYDWNAISWVQRGTDINGESAYIFSGYSVSLSDNGNTVAIGARHNNGNGSSAGHVRIYDWNAVSWVQRGTDIDGEAAGDQLGVSVTLSDNGNTVAIGAPNNNGNGSSAGHVRIYDWNAVSWVQRGTDIDGEAAGDYSGYSVSLSNNGNTVAIGAPNNSGNRAFAGHVRIYDYISGLWVQRGTNIYGDAEDDRSGWSVSLSGGGNTVAIGAPYNDGNGPNVGHVRIYYYMSGTWVKRGNDLDGEAAYVNSGWSVSLSDNAEVVAVGAQYNGGNGSEAGHVRVYSVCNTSVGIDDQTKYEGDLFGFLLYPNPSSGAITIKPTEQNEIESVVVYNMLGQMIQVRVEQIASTGEFIIDLSSEPTGMYLIKIETSKGIKTERVLLQR